MTKNHIKPTVEELEAENKKLLEDIEKEESPEIVEEPKEEPQEEVKENEKVDDTPVEEGEKKEDNPEEVKGEKPTITQEKEPEPTPEVPYKEKFVASSRENQVILAKNRKLTEVIEQAGELPEPTEDELKKEYTDWDIMDDVSKRLAKESLISTRRFAMISGVTKEFKDIDSWNQKVDKFIEDPQTLIDNPDLEGKTEQFKNFATKQSRRGVDFTDLVSAFLYDATKNRPSPKKGGMFPTGSGGPNEKPKPKSDKISVEESERLRVNNYDKYKELLMAGKIASDIEE